MTFFEEDNIYIRGRYSTGLVSQKLKMTLFEEDKSLQRGTGENRENRRRGEMDIIPNTTLSPPALFCIQMGNDVSH